jgi:photosystem II stability/assembly factor-like uncharacterized protein
MNQVGGTAALFDVFFTDLNRGTAVGYSGTILRTTDGGFTWVSQPSGTTESLYGVFFTDADTGTVVGNHGTILRTTDGGSSWTSQASGTTSILYDVAFDHPSAGFAVGAAGTILHTTDGGSTWVRQASGSPYYVLRGISLVDNEIATVVGDNGAILRTTNGGTVWVLQTSGSYFGLRGVSFTDSYTGTAVGVFGIILHTTSGGNMLPTTNGGTSWESQVSGTYNRLEDVSFVDSVYGFAVGEEGVILYTTNGGESWLSNSPPGQTTFVDVQSSVGINFTHELDGTCSGPPVGSGSAWGDYDNDGDIDLYITNHGGASRLYRNDGDLTGDDLPDFTNVAPELGVDETGEVSHAAVFIDYDNDGDQDLYITHWGGNALYQNRLMEDGEVGFVDVTSVAGVGDADRALTASWADYDQDGWLDLYLAKHFDCMPNIRDSRDALFKNNGDGTFTNVSQYLCDDGTLSCEQLNNSHGANGLWFDYDNDNDPDLYIASDVVAAGYPNILWRNDGPDGYGGWTFTDVSTESFTDYSINTHGAGVGDYDNDGFLDLTLSHAQGGFLLRNLHDGTFDDVSDEAGVRDLYTPGGDITVVFGPSFFDYNNDQWLDLHYVCGMISSVGTPQPNVLYENDHDGTFTDVSEQAGIDDPRRGRNSSFCDFNQDGFVDLFVGNFGLPIDLYHNRGRDQGNTNHWLIVTAEGAGAGATNRDAVGARFFLETPDGITQIREIMTGQTSGGGDYRAVYFGLGANTSGNLSVRWTTDETENLGTVTADQHLHVVETVTSVSENDLVPPRYELFQNYPNPFNPTTTFSFAIRSSVFTHLSVYDMLGRRVATLVNERLSPGSYKKEWDAGGMSSGVYVARFQAGSFVATRKLILAR